MDLRADHGELPVLDRFVFTEPMSPVRLVTFLNQTLKRRGYLFGLQKAAEGYVLSVYETVEARSGTADQGRVDQRGDTFRAGTGE